MPNLSVKHVPENVVAKLRERAARNHRSLQGELLALVCAAAEGAPERLAGSEGVETAGGAKTIEQIAREHKARWTRPFAKGPRAVDIVRADRDAR